MVTKKEMAQKLPSDEILKLLLNAEEVLERDITVFGTGAHIVVPQKHAGKKAKVIIIVNK